MNLSNFFKAGLVLSGLFLAGCGAHYHARVQGCVTKQVEGGVEIRCGNQTTFVADGAQGEAGESIVGPQGPQGNPGIDGTNGLDAVIEIVDPCGDGAGFDEILLVLSSGEIVAYFESGGNRFLTVLVNGNYRTTDAQACNFTILNGQVL